MAARAGVARSLLRQRKRPTSVPVGSAETSPFRKQIDQMTKFKISSRSTATAATGLLVLAVFSGVSASQAAPRLVAPPKASNAPSEKAWKAIGFTRIGKTDFFNRGNFLVELRETGTPVFYADFDAYASWKSVTAIRVGKVFDSAALEYEYSDETGGEEKIGRTFNGSGGGLSDPDAEAALDRLKGTRVSDQLVAAGFQAENGSPEVLRLTVKEKSEVLEAIAVLKNGSLDRVYQPFRELGEDSAYLLRGAIPVGYREVKANYSDRMNSRVSFQSNRFSFELTANDGGSIGNTRVIGDLQDVDLAELGVKLTAPVKDAASNFVIRGVNSDPIIRGLTSLNGIAIEKIEAEARKQPACSKSEPLLAPSEGLIEVMLEANSQAEKLGVTHQELARPLLIVKALFDRQLGDTFTLHGTVYRIDFGMFPMCGSLTSPFGDRESTAIVVPKVTNTRTGKTLDMSLMHGHYADSYGFYGGASSLNQVGPEKIVEVFDYLKR
jgi:hypothetical protein